MSSSRSRRSAAPRARRSRRVLPRLRPSRLASSGYGSGHALTLHCRHSSSSLFAHADHRRNHDPRRERGHHDARVDAIVNAANTTLLGGGGVDGAIHRAAGPELLAECRTLGGCPTGEARITRGYRLPARYVIHTVGPSGRAAGTASPHCSPRATATRSRSPRARRCASIAFPAISCGVYGYPFDEAIAIAVREVVRPRPNDADLDLVVFACFGAAALAAYERALERRGLTKTPRRSVGRAVARLSSAGTSGTWNTSRRYATYDGS